MKKLVYIFLAVCFVTVGCKKEVKKEEVSLAISGMTCSKTCAPKVQSALEGKEGVLSAKVSFDDKNATIEYDTNVTNKEDLITFIGGIADGKTFKAGDAGSCCDKESKDKECDTKKECSTEKDKKGCSKDCSDECKKLCENKEGECDEKCLKDCQEKCSDKKEETTKEEVEEIEEVEEKKAA